MDFIQQIKREQTTIGYGLLAGFIASFFINKTDPTLIGVAQHEITIGLLFAGVIFAFIIKAILNRSIMNVSFIKNNIKSNSIILIPIVIILLVLLAPATEVFSFFGSFLKFFGIGGATAALGNVGTAAGVKSLVIGIGAWNTAILLGLPIIVSLISTIAFFILFREPINALTSILVYISNHLIVVGVIIAVLFVMYLMIGKRSTVTTISKGE